MIPNSKIFGQWPSISQSCWCLPSCRFWSTATHTHTHKKKKNQPWLYNDRAFMIPDSHNYGISLPLMDLENTNKVTTLGVSKYQISHVSGAVISPDLPRVRWLELAIWLPSVRQLPGYSWVKWSIPTIWFFVDIRSYILSFPDPCLNNFGN